MTFTKALLMLTSIIGFASLAAAQAPTQTTPVKVGVINSAAFAKPTGGITRLVNAFKALDAEFKPKRDEITQLVTRFDTLQADAVKTPTPAKREQLQILQIEIQRKQEDARVAYSKRLATVTGPVQLSVFNALEAYAKQRGVDVLIDLSKFPDGVLLVNQNADLTSAFVRDFNSKNP